MAASQADLHTLSTIVATLQDTINTPHINKDLEAEALELMELIPEVLEAHPHPGRLLSLLHNCNPLGTLAGYMQIRLALSSRVRLSAVKHFTKCLNICTSPECMAQLSPRIREQMVKSNVFSFLVDVAADSHNINEASAAAELLFVICMKLPNTHEDFIVAGGINRLLARLWDPILGGGDDNDEPTGMQGGGSSKRDRSSAMYATANNSSAMEDLKGYICAIARVFAEHSDCLTAPGLEFVVNSTNTLLLSRCNKQCAALLLEAQTELFKRHPSIYWSEAIGDGHKGTFIQMVDRWLNHSPYPEVTPTLLTLLRILIDIEGMDPLVGTGTSNAQLTMIPFMSSESAWHQATDGAAVHDAAFERLKLQRYLMAQCMTRQATVELHKGFMSVFPALCNLLIPEQSNRDCMAEAAVIVGLACAKLPPVRREISTMVDGYRPWAANIHGTIKQSLEHYATATVRKELLIIDINQTIMNDGEQAQNIDQLDTQRLAAALMKEQERRYSGGGNPVSLDLPAIKFFQKRDPELFTRHIEHLTYVLAVAVMVEAAGQALKGKPSVGSNTAVGGSSPTPAAPASPVPAAHHHPSLSPIPNQTGPATPRSGRRTRTPVRGAAGLDTSLQQFPQRGVEESGSSYLHWIQEQASSGKLGKGGASLNQAFSPAKKKPPFRPGSPSVSTTFASKKNSKFNTTPSPTPRSRSAAAVNNSLNASGGGGLLDGVKDHPVVPDEYMSMALMMHLPITLGVHYNRPSRGAVRKIDGPQGSYLQPVHRNQNQTWTANDVNQGELYVLFVPFHKLTIDRIVEELATVERHLVNVKKLLLTTPNSKRTRRWFLHDMLNYILPKTDLLLRDLLELTEKFSAEDVVYQMGIIRLVDEGKREKADPFAAAAEAADAAMPQEIMRFSTGKFKDVLHSGNLQYAVKRLRDHYVSSMNENQFNDSAAMSGAGGVGGGPNDSGNDGMPSQLVDIEREIQKLERRNAEDVWGNEDQAEMDDDVESDFDDEGMFESQPQHDPHTYLAGSGGHQHQDPYNSAVGQQDYPAEFYPDAHRVPSTAGGSSSPPNPHNLSNDNGATMAPTSDYLGGGGAMGGGFGAASESSLPPHLRHQLMSTDSTNALQGPADEKTFDAPTMTDFDAMYAAVEQPN